MNPLHIATAVWSFYFSKINLLISIVIEAYKNRTNKLIGSYETYSVFGHLEYVELIVNPLHKGDGLNINERIRKQSNL